MPTYCKPDNPQRLTEDMYTGLCTAWRNPTRTWDEKPVRKSVYKYLALA